MRSWIIFVLVTVFLAGGRGEGQEYFRRGDANASGRQSITDAILVLSYAFVGSDATPPCLDAADANDNGAIGMDDAIILLTWLFLGGDPPAPPFAECGLASSGPTLGCASFPPCEAGDAIFFCCDVSGSMNEPSKLKSLEDEVLKNVSQFSPRVEFGLIFFSTTFIRFPESGEPARGTAEMKESATAFVRAVAAGHGTCSKAALLAALDMADLSKATRKVIIYYSDGFNTCPGSDSVTYGTETLSEVSTRNAGKVHINAICIGASVDEEWMRQLASENRGLFTRIQ